MGGPVMRVAEDPSPQPPPPSGEGEPQVIALGPGGKRFRRDAPLPLQGRGVGGRGLALALGVLLLGPSPAFAGSDLHVPPAAAGPFVLLLVAIAALPLVAARWWNRHGSRLLVVALLAVPTAGYLLARGEPGRAALFHELGEYFSFIALLVALFAAAGGIVLRGDLVGRPRTNLLFLAAGAVLANVIGTTGASMVLIRPVLRINCERKRTGHIPVFFIIAVGNTGGLLTPLGPPLFLGFLKGVGFFWTAALWREWLFVNGLVLGAFYVLGSGAYRRGGAGRPPPGGGRLPPPPGGRGGGGAP